MAHLLAVSRLQAKAMQRKGAVPLILEYGVSPETAPYLVSSSSSVMWINEAHPDDTVKAAVRAVSLGDFFAEVIDAVIAMGTTMQWGNVQPLTAEGLQAAIDHVAFYDMGPLEMLIPRAHPGVDPSPLEEDLNDVPDEVPLPPPVDDDAEDPELSSTQRVDAVERMPVALRTLLADISLPLRPCSWIPEGTVVVVPKDRNYVGVVNRLTTKKIAGVVHNAARGIAVAWATDELAG